MNRRDKLLVFIGQIVNFPAYVLAAQSASLIPIGLVMLIQNISPFIVAAMSFLILRERTSFLELINMSASFVCVVLVLLDRHAQSTLNL